jgi:hypothetical protein
VSFRELRYAVEDGVCTLTLDRPDKLNALTGTMLDAFLEKRPPRFTLRPSTGMPPFYPWWTDRPFEA